MKSLIKFSFIIFIISFSSVNADDDLADSEYKYTYDLYNEFTEAYDPYENLNRKIFAFNSILDHFILKPVAVVYKNVTNDYIKARVGNFTENLVMPLTTVNYLLQMNLGESLKSLWVFAINSTIGIGGLFDVAGKSGLKTKQQTLGSTLAHYGVCPGPYIIIPFFGSTNGRDVTDSLFTNNALNPLRQSLPKNFNYGVTGVRLIHDREKLLPFTDHITRNSPDPYIAVRSAVHQNRETNVEYPNKDFKCPTISNE